MQMRFLCGAYAFCILHFGMYSAYTANNCHIKICAGIFIFFSSLASHTGSFARPPDANTEPGKQSVHTQKNYNSSKDFSLLCIIANVLFISCFIFSQNQHIAFHFALLLSRTVFIFQRLLQIFLFFCSLSLVAAFISLVFAVYLL